MLNGPRYTDNELMSRLKFIVGLSLAFTLTGIVFVVLYSLIFVTQPMEQSPNDAKFFELITPIATFLTGILSGIMLVKDDKKPEEKPAEPDTVYVPTEPLPEVPSEPAPAAAPETAPAPANAQDPFSTDPNQQK